MTEFRPKLDTLPHAQRALWPRLSGAKNLGFTLYGGTALALRLGHRASIDFDFFSERQLDKEALRKAIPALQDAVTLQDAPATLTALAPSGDEAVKLSFFGGISFGRVGYPELTSDGIAEIASTEDLFATKLKVIFDRIEAKDYRDIVAMVNAGWQLSTGLGAGVALFGSAFQPAEALKTLTYFEGGDLAQFSAQERQVLESSVLAVRAIPQLKVVSKILGTGQFG